MELFLKSFALKRLLECEKVVFKKLVPALKKYVKKEVGQSSGKVEKTGLKLFPLFFRQKSRSNETSNEETERKKKSRLKTRSNEKSFERGRSNDLSNEISGHGSR